MVIWWKRNKKTKIIIIILIVSIITAAAYAHPGRTDSKGGHTCRTNCEKWGLTTGEYHYHNKTPDQTTPVPTATTSPTVTSNLTPTPTMPEINSTPLNNQNTQIISSKQEEISWFEKKIKAIFEWLGRW